MGLCRYCGYDLRASPPPLPGMRRDVNRSAMTSEGPNAPLSYAAPGTSPRPKIPVRRHILAMVSVTVALAAWRFGPGVVSELKRLSPG
jgi:hypothetical protein